MLLTFPNLAFNGKKVPCADRWSCLAQARASALPLDVVVGFRCVAGYCRVLFGLRLIATRIAHRNMFRAHLGKPKLCIRGPVSSRACRVLFRQTPLYARQERRNRIMYSSRYRYMAGPVPRPLTSCLGGLRSESSQLDLVPSYAQKGLRYAVPLELCLPPTNGIAQVRLVRRHLLQVAVWLAVLTLALRGRVASDDESVLPRAQEPPTTGPSASRSHDTHTYRKVSHKSVSFRLHAGPKQERALTARPAPDEPGRSRAGRTPASSAAPARPSSSSSSSSSSSPGPRRACGRARSGRRSRPGGR